MVNYYENNVRISILIFVFMNIYIYTFKPCGLPRLGNKELTNG